MRCNHALTTTPFCPHCGLSIKASTPGQELLAYARTQLQNHSLAMRNAQQMLDRDTWEYGWSKSIAESTLKASKKHADLWTARVGWLVKVIGCGAEAEADQ